MTNKPIFTPTSISDYDTCKLKYWWRWEKLLAFPSRVAVQPTLGTFGHVLHAAHERGDDPAKSLAAEVRKVRSSTAYTALDHSVVEQLQKEAQKMFNGGAVKNSQGKVSRFSSYSDYRQGLEIDGQRLVAMAVERRLIVDLGPVVVAPTLDLILCTEDEKEIWVAEHKFTERDDTGWRLRWTMDGQTTLQVMATEEFYDREVMGLLLLPVSYGRKKKPKGSDDSILKRPIVRIERLEPRWVVKNSPKLRSGMMDRLEDLKFDYLHRVHNHRWPPTGMLTRACDRCSYRGICSGEDSAKRLQPLLANAHEYKLDRLRKGRRG